MAGTLSGLLGEMYGLSWGGDVHPAAHPELARLGAWCSGRGRSELYWEPKKPPRVVL